MNPGCPRARAKLLPRAGVSARIPGFYYLGLQGCCWQWNDSSKTEHTGPGIRLGWLARTHRPAAPPKVNSSSAYRRDYHWPVVTLALRHRIVAGRLSSQRTQRTSLRHCVTRDSDEQVLGQNGYGGIQKVPSSSSGGVERGERSICPAAPRVALLLTTQRHPRQAELLEWQVARYLRALGGQAGGCMLTTVRRYTELYGGQETGSRPYLAMHVEDPRSSSPTPIASHHHVEDVTTPPRMEFTPVPLAPTQACFHYHVSGLGLAVWRKRGR